MFNVLKGIILSVSLTQAFFLNANLQELNAEYANKLMQISELGKRIAEQDAYMHSIRTNIIGDLQRTVKEKKLSPEQVEEFWKTIINAAGEFDKAFNAFREAVFLSKAATGLLVKEFLKDSTNDMLGKFESKKFFCLRIINEYLILENLIVQYEKLQYELLIIMQKKTELETAQQ